jgi:hypothetical protein
MTLTPAKIEELRRLIAASRDPLDALTAEVATMRAHFDASTKSDYERGFDDAWTARDRSLDEMRSLLSEAARHTGIGELRDRIDAALAAPKTKARK